MLGVWTGFALPTHVCVRHFLGNMMQKFGEFSRMNVFISALPKRNRAINRSDSVLVGAYQSACRVQTAAPTSVYVNGKHYPSLRNCAGNGQWSMANRKFGKSFRIFFLVVTERACKAT